MSRLVIPRTISLLFAFNGLVVLLLAFWASGVMGLPEPLQDSIAPLFAISVLPLAFLMFVIETISEALSIGPEYGMSAAAVCVTSLSVLISFGLWKMERWALRLAGICIGAAGALFPTALVYSLPHRLSYQLEVSEPTSYLEVVLSAILMLVGGFVCIWLGVYLLRAARAGQGEYPAPELRLPFNNK